MNEEFNSDELIEYILAMMTLEEKIITLNIIERLRKLEPEYVEQLFDALTKVVENDAKELISLLDGFIDKGDRLRFLYASTEFNELYHLRMLVGIINREIRS